MPILKLTFFCNSLSGNQVLKFVYQRNTKGKNKKEPRKFNFPSL